MVNSSAIQYTSPLLAAIAARDSFVLGGPCDVLALDYLQAHHISPYLTFSSSIESFTPKNFKAAVGGPSAKTWRSLVIG